MAQATRMRSASAPRPLATQTMRPLSSSIAPHISRFQYWELRIIWLMPPCSRSVL